MSQKENKTNIDTTLLVTSLLLLAFGLVMIYSASSIYALEIYKDSYHFIKKQLVFAAVSLFVMFFFYKFKYQYLTKFVYVLLGISLVLLVCTYIPGLGVTAGGARRWVKLGFFNFQPSELTKAALVIYFAYVINKKREKMKFFSTGFLPCMIVASLFILLILRQPDFGTAFIIGFVMIIMLFIGGSKMSYIFSTVVAALPLLYFAIMTSDYRKKRIFAFLNPWEDPQNTGFQIIQSLLAFFAGGLLGRGLGDGQQKLFYLPEAHTDFIFAVIAEELGFVGIVVLLSIFLLFLYRGFKIAFQSKDPLATLLAFGITSLIGFEITFNIGVVMGIFPTKGIVLPFLSYGGSSLMVTLAMVGILLNISAQNKTKAKHEN